MKKKETISGEADRNCSAWLSTESCIVVIMYFETPGYAEEFHPDSRNPEKDWEGNDRDRLDARMVRGWEFFYSEFNEKLYFFSECLQARELIAGNWNANVFLVWEW